jgi:hypothetical protein
LSSVVNKAFYDVPILSQPRPAFHTGELGTSNLSAVFLRKISKRGQLGTGLDTDLMTL